MKKSNSTNKVIKSFTLSPRRILELRVTAEYNGLSMSSQLEILIQKEYRKVRRFLKDES